MRESLICHIPGLCRSYEILYCPGILSSSIGQEIQSFGHQFVIITDTKVAALHGEKLKASLTESGLHVEMITFPVGEKYKTREMKQSLEDKLFAKKYGKDTCIIALGGGVVTDMGGYLAATYCRGINLVMIPTTLLAMVDASIGGKNGVNVPQGKNMVGTIYPPSQVIIDPTVLDSLPLEEFKNGIVEMIKHGLIVSSDHFIYLEEHISEILAKKPPILQKAIMDSCCIKKQIVQEEEQDRGKRHLLNFGHTVGHALESLTQYTMAHGEAVAIGMIAEAHLSMQEGKLDLGIVRRIEHLLSAYGIGLQLPCTWTCEEMIEAMVLDKKSIQGTPRFVMLEGIGQAAFHEGSYSFPTQKERIKNSLDWINDALRSD